MRDQSARACWIYCDVVQYMCEINQLGHVGFTVMWYIVVFNVIEVARRFTMFGCSGNLQLLSSVIADSSAEHSYR